MARIKEVPFVKGHGTGNDFIVIPDLDGKLEITPEQVIRVCDRHRGLGADGVLRVVRTEHMKGMSDQTGVAEFFMDYRNADGTVAEMCGNGARCFSRFGARLLGVERALRFETLAGTLTAELLGEEVQLCGTEGQLASHRELAHLLLPPPTEARPHCLCRRLQNGRPVCQPR